MFVLNTNVVSELMRERPNPQVLGWIDNQLSGRLVRDLRNRGGDSNRHSLSCLLTDLPNTLDTVAAA